MQLGAGVVGPRQAAAAEADGGHVEVAAVLLDEQVRGHLRDAEQRVGRAVDRHRRVDAAVVVVIRRQLQARVQLEQRQSFGQVAVDLVRRAEDEAWRPGCGGGVASSRFSVPLALTPKSVWGSRRAQSCDGCAAVWITSSIRPPCSREDPRRRIARRGCRSRASGTRAGTARASARWWARWRRPARRSARACRSPCRSRRSRPREVRDRLGADQAS